MGPVLRPCASCMHPRCVLCLNTQSHRTASAASAGGSCACLCILHSCCTGRGVSDKCQAEVAAYKIERSKHINRDVALGRSRWTAPAGSSFYHHAQAVGNGAPMAEQPVPQAVTAQHASLIAHANSQLKPLRTTCLSAGYPSCLYPCKPAAELMLLLPSGALTRCAASTVEPCRISNRELSPCLVLLQRVHARMMQRSSASLPATAPPQAAWCSASGATDLSAVAKWSLT